MSAERIDPQLLTDASHLMAKVIRTNGWKPDIIRAANDLMVAQLFENLELHYGWDRILMHPNTILSIQDEKLVVDFDQDRLIHQEGRKTVIEGDCFVHAHLLSQILNDHLIRREEPLVLPLLFQNTAHKYHARAEVIDPRLVSPIPSSVIDPSRVYRNFRGDPLLQTVSTIHNSIVRLDTHGRGEFSLANGRIDDLQFTQDGQGHVTGITDYRIIGSVVAETDKGTLGLAIKHNKNFDFLAVVYYGYNTVYWLIRKSDKPGALQYIKHFPENPAPGYQPPSEELVRTIAEKLMEHDVYQSMQHESEQ